CGTIRTDIGVSSERAALTSVIPGMAAMNPLQRWSSFSPAFPVLVGEDIRGVVEIFSHEIQQSDEELLRVMAGTILHLYLGAGSHNAVLTHRATRSQTAHGAEARTIFVLGPAGMELVAGLRWSTPSKRVTRVALPTFPVFSIPHTLPRGGPSRHPTN